MSTTVQVAPTNRNDHQLMFLLPNPGPSCLRVTHFRGLKRNRKESPPTMVLRHLDTEWVVPISHTSTPGPILSWVERETKRKPTIFCGSTKKKKKKTKNTHTHNAPEHMWEHKRFRRFRSEVQSRGGRATKAARAVRPGRDPLGFDSGVRSCGSKMDTPQNELLW